jgi:hypothetical protein
MKQFYLTLTFLLPFIGGTGFAQTGMTVFGDCYVSETSSVGFFGDELTLQGDVGGEGSLIMAGKDTQTLVARDQKIDHLVIANPTVVNLKGKLTVSKSLIVEQGVLHVLPLAQLHVPLQATVFVAPGTQIIHAGIVIQRGTDEAPRTKQTFGMSEAVVSPEEVSATGVVSIKLPLTRLLSAHTAYSSPYLKALAPPPRWV